MARRDRPTLFVRVTDRNFLVPESSYDAERLSRYKPGTVLEAALHEPRNRSLNGLFWKVMEVAAENSDYPDSEALVIAIKIALLYVDEIRQFDGGVHIQPRSLSDMDREGFQQFYNEALSVICSHIMPGTDPKDLEDEAKARMKPR